LLLLKSIINAITICISICLLSGIVNSITIEIVWVLLLWGSSRASFTVSIISTSCWSRSSTLFSIISSSFTSTGSVTSTSSSIVSLAIRGLRRSLCFLLMFHGYMMLLSMLLMFTQ